jgi:hypothetical protein
VRQKQIPRKYHNEWEKTETEKIYKKWKKKRTKNVMHGLRKTERTLRDITEILRKRHRSIRCWTDRENVEQEVGQTKRQIECHTCYKKWEKQRQRTCHTMSETDRETEKTSCTEWDRQGQENSICPHDELTHTQRFLPTCGISFSPRTLE